MNTKYRNIIFRLVAIILKPHNNFKGIVNLAYHTPLP